VTTSLEEYQRQLGSLRADRSNGHAKPHKTCLLLAVIDLVAKGDITSNKIVFSRALKQQFTKHFDQYKQGNDKDDPSQPFFYLESAPFWHHHPAAKYLDEYQRRTTDRKHGGGGVIERIIEYAYVDDELFSFMQSSIVRPQLLTALLENSEDLSLRFQRWAFGVGKSEKTIKNYLGALNGSVVNWLHNAGLGGQAFTQINNLSEYKAISAQATQLEIFEIRNTKGKGMYSAAIKLYGDFLADVIGDTTTEDIQAISRDNHLTSTEKAILVNARRGQGQYRNNLINYWGGCAVTGHTNQRFLVASHIKPWRVADNAERLDPYNGLLLTPNLDKAFDLGYISFEETGTIRISKELENYATLGVQSDLYVPLEREHQDYLAYHRDQCFRG